MLKLVHRWKSTLTSGESFCWINASLHSHLWFWFCIWTGRSFTRMDCPWFTSRYLSKHLFPSLKKPNRSILLPRYWPTSQMQTQCEGAVYRPWQLQVICSCPSALLWRDVQYLLCVSRKPFSVLLCGLSSWVLVTSGLQLLSPSCCSKGPSWETGHAEEQSIAMASVC